MADFDLVIRGGTVIDGSGAPGRTADVAITGDAIVAIGEVRGRGEAELDAGGLAVAPGFIDVHAHDDAAVVRDPRVDFKVMQGVTTDVVGNCGAGVAPASDEFRRYYATGMAPILGDSPLPWTTTAEYFAAVDAAHPACNVAAYVPHGVLRFAAMGLERREPSERELERMRELLDEGMRAGAIGMSTGLVYVPGTFARTDELAALASVVARYGGIYTSHIRNEGEGLLDAVAEAIAVGERGGCGVQISHHKAAGANCFGMTKASLARIAEARARGLDVTIDVYPYVASSSSLAAMWRLGRERAFESAPAIIASVKHQHEKYEGRYVSDIAAEMDLPVGDAIRRLLEEEENSPSVIMFIMDEDDVRRVVADEHCMVGSDGLPSGGKPHPRLYGTMARVIQQYVREQPALTLEEAVRKMTSLPAAKHRLGRRGMLRTGWHADVVVFDPATVEDIATYTEPRQYPRGIEYVVVNGQVAAERGRQTDARAGRMLRREPAPA
ncbi:MAG TPA: D-aminoacylase [Dehalococcoidia bacterium]|nr:D-aminoacylase [Dehalococcoidia bacterium]